MQIVLDVLAQTSYVLQENHINDQYSTAAEIARILAFPYVYQIAVSPSHIDSSTNLGNAILSKNKLSHIDDVTYPYPDFDLHFEDGRPAVLHNKMVQIYALNNLTIANTQMLPLGIFGKSYSMGDGKGLSERIDDLLCNKLSGPIILCGDFNYDIPREIYPRSYKKLSLRETLPNVATRPSRDAVKLISDHILISDGLKVLDSDVVEVNADHYLCYTDIQM